MANNSTLLNNLGILIVRRIYETLLINGLDGKQLSNIKASERKLFRIAAYDEISFFKFFLFLFFGMFKSNAWAATDTFLAAFIQLINISVLFKYWKEAFVCLIEGDGERGRAGACK